MTNGRIDIHFGDNIERLQAFDGDSFSLIYIDPPFNTGKKQSRPRLRTVLDSGGDRVGFKGQRYRTESLGAMGYNDRFDDFSAFITPRLIEAHRLLTPDGSFFFHIDYREVHRCKLLLDEIFGEKSFFNEIIWAYDYGARAKKR